MSAILHLRFNTLLQPSLWLCLAGLGLALFSGGCSTKPASASFASAVIHNKTPAQIQEVAAQVFREDGYAAAATGPLTMVYQKEGTAANNLAYSGVVGSYYGARTLVRVKAQLVDLGGSSYRLQCQTYMVRNAGESFFEEETKLTNLRSGPYQRLVNEVAKRLQ